MIDQVITFFPYLRLFAALLGRGCASNISQAQGVYCILKRGGLPSRSVSLHVGDIFPSYCPSWSTRSSTSCLTSACWKAAYWKYRNFQVFSCRLFVKSTSGSAHIYCSRGHYINY